MNKKFGEFINYCFISIFCTAILYLVFYIVDNITDGNYLLANFFSYSISFFILYILNQRLFKVKFKSRIEKANQLIRFVIVRAIGFPVDSVVLTYIINNYNINNTKAKIICSIIMFLYNYVTNKYVVFKTRG